MKIKLLFLFFGLLASCHTMAQVTKIEAGYVSSFLICGDSVRSCGVGVLNGHVGSYLLPLPKTIPNLSDVVQMSVGFQHALFLKSDGTVWTCGYNTSGLNGFTGVLGISGLSFTSTPIQIPGLTNVVSVSAGLQHSLFVKSDSTLWGCGKNNFSCLGTGLGQIVSTPVQLDSDLTHKYYVASAGDNYSVMLAKQGNVKKVLFRGKSENGQGGLITESYQYDFTIQPVFKAISAGYGHTLFLTEDGHVKASGKNVVGQCGFATQNYDNSLDFIPGLNGIVEVSAGGLHSLFLKNDGTVWSCGNNSDGQLGLGDNNTRFSLVQIPGITDAVAISAGYNHSLILNSDGTVLSFGRNSGNLGIGNQVHTNVPTPMTQECIVTPPTVTMPDQDLCLGNAVNEGPTITGSNAEYLIVVNNSISVTNPKALKKNNNSVFVLNDADVITRYDFNGNLLSSLPNLTLTGIDAFTVDDSNHVYVFTGNGNIYKCDSTGTLLNTQTSLYVSNTGNDLGFTTPPSGSLYSENLFLLDSDPGAACYLTGINTYDNSISNSAIYPTPGTNNAPFTGMDIDHFYENRRVLLANPTTGILKERILYPDGTPNFDYKETYLVDSLLTLGMELDCISSANLLGGYTFVASSEVTGILATGRTIAQPDGSVYRNIDTSLTSHVNAVQPVGIAMTPYGNAFEIWVADRGQNKILRIHEYAYDITPALPAGLSFDPNSGQIIGIPTVATASQDYVINMYSPLGNTSDTFSLQVSNSNSVSNGSGTYTSSTMQNDGSSVSYTDNQNCAQLLVLTDFAGGTSPGNTTVEQTVDASGAVAVGNKNFVRRVNKVTAEQTENLSTNLSMYYTYQDLAAYNATLPSSTFTNDTLGGTQQFYFLHMHDRYDTVNQIWNKEILHVGPVAALWIPNKHVWEVTFPVNKLSEFYASPVSVEADFDCSNTGTATITANDFYLLKGDTLTESGIYIDTLANMTGCDSVLTLNLTIVNTIGLNDDVLAAGMHIYPNPSAGIFQVKFNQELLEPKKIQVTNVIGEVIWTQTFTASGILDLSNQSKGVYFVRIEGENLNRIWRIIKQ